jgi:hypothetical protein
MLNSSLPHPLPCYLTRTRFTLALAAAGTARVASQTLPPNCNFIIGVRLGAGASKYQRLTR